MNILSRTDRSFRRDATDTVNKTTPPIQNIYTHHEDGKEYNQDISNLMIWSNNDKNIAHIAHIVAHDSNNYSASPYNKNIDIYDYDTVSKNWVCVATLHVSY